VSKWHQLVRVIEERPSGVQFIRYRPSDTLEGYITLYDPFQTCTTGFDTLQHVGWVVTNLNLT